MPRALAFAYTLRNKRGVGHVAGDVEANEIDAATAVRVADWCLCELIRFFHNMPIEDAQALLDALAVRQLPAVWSVGGVRRVLTPGLDAKQQVLLLLYGEGVGVPVEDLFAWVEYSRLDHFRARVLVPLHRGRLVELDRSTDTVTISPLGSRRVEEEILPALTD